MQVATCVSDLPEVKMAPLFESRVFPLLVTPNRPTLDFVSWGVLHRTPIERLISDSGALLFRGFGLKSAMDFERFVDAVCLADWLEAREGSVPRSHVQEHVFTSTEYNPEFRLYVHNENSYVTSWPLYVFFYCRVPAAEGGETPLADSSAVYRRLPKDVVERFTKVGWLYERRFRPWSAITWEKAFGVRSREEADDYCRRNYMVPEWSSQGLTVRFRRWAALRHPRTKEMTWFNHGTVFHPYTQDPSVKTMMQQLGEDFLVYKTFYGDGSAIEAEVIQILDEAYTAETVSFPWQAGDVLMLDNMRIAHGRSPYSGNREVLVAMKQRISCEDVADRQQYDMQG